METLFQICALAVAAAVICVLIRQQNAAMSLLLSLMAAVMIVIVSLRFFQPILDVLQQLRTMSNLDQEVTKPMMKVVGIGMVSQIADDICTDAGERALGKAVELGGTMLSLYSALPLLTAVLSLLQTGLGNGT